MLLVCKIAMQNKWLYVFQPFVTATFIWVVTILLVSLSLYLCSWGSSTSAADAKWHATVDHSANREIGQPIRSSAVSVNGFWLWSLSQSDDPPQPQFEERWSRGVAWDWIEMQKLAGKIGDNFGGLDGPIGGGGTYFPELSYLHNLPMEIMGNWVFFVVQREVLKAPPAAMDVCLMKKNTMPS